MDKAKNAAELAKNEQVVYSTRVLHLKCIWVINYE